MRVGSTNSSLTAQPLCGMRPKISHETEDTGTGAGTGAGTGTGPSRAEPNTLER